VTLTADPARRTERALAAAQANLEAGALIAKDDAVCEATGASTAPYPRDAAGFATGREAEALRLIQSAVAEGSPGAGRPVSRARSCPQARSCR
jgi:hypothetical protein